MWTRFASMLAGFGLVAALGATPARAMMFGVGSGVGTNGSTLYRVDDFASVPTRANIADTGRILNDIAIAPNGNAYVIDGVSGLYQINLTNGSTSFLFNVASGQNSLEAANNTTLYSWGFTDPTIYRINLSTGSFTPIVNTGFLGADLALDLNGTDLYGSTLDGRLIRVDLNTLAVTDIGPMSVTPGLRVPGLDFNPSGQLFATSGNDGSTAAEVYAVNKFTAAATLIGDISGVGNLGMSITPAQIAVVPEPSTLLMLGVGSVGLVALSRLRRPKQGVSAGKGVGSLM
jgi:hypothetical protein